jgi:hypothetical protein
MAEGPSVLGFASTEPTFIDQCPEPLGNPVSHFSVGQNRSYLLLMNDLGARIEGEEFAQGLGLIHFQRSMEYVWQALIPLVAGTVFHEMFMPFPDRHGLIVGEPELFAKKQLISQPPHLREDSFS